MKCVVSFIALLFTVSAVHGGDRVAYVNRDVTEDYVGADGKAHTRVVTKSFMTAVADAVPVVTAKATFQSGSYHAGHNCPNCGQETTRIGNDSGPTHDHTCTNPKCRAEHGVTTWHHDDAVSTRTSLKINWGRRWR